MPADRMRRENKIKLVKKKDFAPFHLWLIIKGTVHPSAAAYRPLSLQPWIIFIH